MRLIVSWMGYKRPSFGLAILLISSWHGSCLGSPAEIKDRTGAVSSESKICSEIGVELLKRGGNAADALVGTVLCVGVIGMQHSGVGGGGFMLVRDSGGSYEAIDFRELAPAAAFEDMYQGNVPGSVYGGLASAVPGDLRGLEYVHNKYGILPWRAVCNPAIHVARYGFPVTEDLVRYMNVSMKEDNMFLIDDPQWSVDFAPNGTLLGLGETLTRKRYANTLEKIAERGADGFYTGEIAKQTIAAVQATNGTMTLEDLASYRVVIRDPISINYRGYKVTSTGAPSGGSVALSILKILEGYNLTYDALNLHRLDEAMRYSYGAHAELGDPDFFDYMAAFETSLLQPEHVALIRANISDNFTQDPSAYNPSGYQIPESHGTSHIVATDASGLSITLTSTINLLFGNKQVVPETGVILNNEMNDFSIPGVTNEFGFVPSPINFIRSRKRPLSSITPIIVEHPNGTLYLTIGAAGGSRIITSTVQAVMHVLDHGMTLPQALKEPRIHDQLLPDLTTFEVGFPDDMIKGLLDRGHSIREVPFGYSAVQGVRVLSNGTFEAAGEPRQLNSGGLAI
ncbi:gamma-glutamyltransferase [Bisporella sp. PMI_857]|nr:gamma-glutamyltransferase [Bisporella sp. PMI_857]